MLIAFMAIEPHWVGRFVEIAGCTNQLVDGVTVLIDLLHSQSKLPHGFSLTQNDCFQREQAYHLPKPLQRYVIQFIHSRKQLTPIRTYRGRYGGQERLQRPQT
jgi:hypothetical protein